MMNQVVKAKWVTALRSGQYKQTTDKLQHYDAYCCLGVLCELSRLENGFGIKENLIEANAEVLGSTIKKWAGLNSMVGAWNITIAGIASGLTDHNDAGRTFFQIADAIEEQL